MEDSALFTCILTGTKEAREEIRLVIFDKRDLTRVVMAERMEDLVVMNSVDAAFHNWKTCNVAVVLLLTLL